MFKRIQFLLACWETSSLSSFHSAMHLKTWQLTPPAPQDGRSERQRSWSSWLIGEVTSSQFCHALFVRKKSPGWARTEREGIHQAWLLKASETLKVTSVVCNSSEQNEDHKTHADMLNCYHSLCTFFSAQDEVNHTGSLCQMVKSLLFCTDCVDGVTDSLLAELGYSPSKIKWSYIEKSNPRIKKWQNTLF